MNIMHELEEERDPLKKQLSNIEQIFQEFADQYDAAAQSLRNGFVPEPIPSIQLEAARKVVTDTFAAISEAGDVFDMEALSENASLAEAGNYLMHVHEERRKAEEIRKKLEEAGQVVAQVAALGHNSDPDVLASVTLSVVEMTAELDAKNLEAAENLLSGEHPMTMLAAYARHRDTLSDTEYDSFRETIQAVYGRSLLRDIDRGRVTFDAGNSDDTLEHTIELTTEIPVDVAEGEVDDSTVSFDTVNEGIEEEITAPVDFEGMAEIEIDEELLEETNIDVNPEELPPMYAEYDAGEGEDTLLPFLEGDGMQLDNNEVPEATVNGEEPEDKDQEDI